MGNGKASAGKQRQAWAIIGQAGEAGRGRVRQGEAGRGRAEWNLYPAYPSNVAYPSNELGCFAFRFIDLG